MAARPGKGKRGYPQGPHKCITDNLRGKNTDKFTAVDAAYEMLGYGIHHADATNSVAAGIPKTEALVKELDAFAARCNEQPDVPHPLPPWFNAFLMGFLSKLLTT